MKVASYTHGTVTVLSDHYYYTYVFNPYQLRQLRQLMKHHQFGAAWQLLRRFTLLERRNA